MGELRAWIAADQETEYRLLCLLDGCYFVHHYSSTKLTHYWSLVQDDLGTL